MNYDEMVKCAYEDIVDSFEKEAKPRYMKGGRQAAVDLVNKRSNRLVHDLGTEFSNMPSFILYPSPEEAFKMGRDIQKKEKLFYKAYDLYKHPMPNGYGPHTRSAVLRNLDHMSNRGRSFDTIRAAAVIRSSFR